MYKYQHKKSVIICKPLNNKMVNVTVIKTLLLSTVFINYVYGAGQCYTTTEWNSRFGGTVFLGGKCNIDQQKYAYLVCDKGKRLKCASSYNTRYGKVFAWKADGTSCVQKEDQWCSS